MTNNSTDCNRAGAPPVSSRTRARPPLGSLLGLVAGIAAVLAPKCPLCLAAYLALLGLGIGLAQLAPVLLPFGIGIASVALVSLVVQERKRR